MNFHPSFLTLFGTFLGLIHLCGTLCSIHALFYSRSSQGAIAWCLSLIVIPYIALPLYLIFGRSHFKGYKELQKNFRDLASTNHAGIDQLFAVSRGIDEKNLFLKTFEQLSRRGWTEGNLVRLLPDGETTFKTIFESISSAEKYVLIEFFIIESDAVGDELKKVLCEASLRGVKCYVLYDEIGSAHLSLAYIEELRQAGVLVHSFDTTIGILNSFQLNLY